MCPPLPTGPLASHTSSVGPCRPRSRPSPGILAPALVTSGCGAESRHGSARRALGRGWLSPAQQLPVHLSILPLVAATLVRALPGPGSQPPERCPGLARGRPQGAAGSGPACACWAGEPGRAGVSPGLLAALVLTSVLTLSFSPHCCAQPIPWDLWEVSRVFAPVPGGAALLHVPGSHAAPYTYPLTGACTRTRTRTHPRRAHLHRELAGPPCLQLSCCFSLCVRSVGKGLLSVA